MTVGVFGCGDDTQLADIVRASDMPAPASRGVLRVASDEPLSFGTAVSVDSVTLLVADRVTNDVWLLDASAPQVRVHRVLSGGGRVRAKLVGISRAAHEWRLVDRGGGLYRFDRDSWEFVGASRVAFGRGAIMAAAADSAGGFVLLVRRPAAQGGAVIEHALLMVGGDGAVRESWRTAPSARGAGAASRDLVTLAPAAGGWLVAGTEPPRALHFDAAGTFERLETFLTTPRRRVSAEVVAQFRRAAAAAGMSGAIRPPTHYPPITALRQAGAAYLAVPIVGGSTGEAEGLDLYCGARYTRTLFDAPSIAQVLLTEHGVIVLSEGTASYAIDYYRLVDLPLTCEAAS
ncbi:MAG TPA: hypothetical protein VMN60_01970 [Longimicrobiales bacterium]|nr:hypothetical protein [Longimicrobiales bacterium]